MINDKNEKKILLVLYEPITFALRLQKTGSSLNKKTGGQDLLKKIKIAKKVLTN